MIIAVGSKNPTKIKAVKVVVNKLFPGAKVESVDVKSGVSDQPKTDEETMKGAITRAKNAQKATNADFGIGLEGGMHKIGKDWFECGWIAIVDKNGKIGIGSSSRWQVSKKISKPLLKGQELADVVNELTGRDDVHVKEGIMGLITKNHLPRYKAYSHGIIFAFAPFISNPIFWD
ncbi:MAG: inosine/xanthosine triphosphatase [Candidatus Curtissbacteria bacterium]|nr:inosine/xanthosine triphosphatase [Candidatus Curtissbacteria bacterium]